MSPASPHLTSFDLDALDIGAVAAAEANALRTHLDGCPACRENQRTRRTLADQFAREVLPRSLPVVRQRLLPTARRRFGWWALALSPVACGAVLALLLFGRGASDLSPSNRPVEDLATGIGDLGIKGGWLFAYVRRGDKVTRFAAGGVLAAGDALRFAVEPHGNRHLLIAGVDGSGRASAYYRFGQWTSAPVAPGGRFEVPGSIVLDDSAGPERIFAMLSAKPIDGGRVRALLESLARQGPGAIRESAELQVPGVEASSIIFEKRARHP
jgi:hypothetical protein